MRLLGHIALITGAANGIGRATSIQMAREGAKVILVDVDPAGLASLARQLGPSALASESDIFTTDGRAQAIARGVDAFGAPDILVNCVGGSTKLPRSNLPLDEMTEDQWDATIDFNLKGTFLCCRDLVPHMKRQRKGAIVNLSSLSGRGITPESGVAYATAKAGLIGFTRRLAVELAPSGIRCNAVAPGYVLTDRIRDRLWNPAGEAGQADLKRRIPVARLAEPQEVGSVISFLASDEASYLTGVTVDCNGGMFSA